jgi:hypothetical protein
METELKTLISEAIAQTPAQVNDEKKEKVKWDERLKRACFEWIQNELEIRYLEEYLRVLKVMESESPPTSAPWSKSIKNVVEVRREICQQIASFGNNASLWIWQDISREFNSFRRRKRKPIEFISKKKVIIESEPKKAVIEPNTVEIEPKMAAQESEPKKEVNTAVVVIEPVTSIN